MAGEPSFEDFWADVPDEVPPALEFSSRAMAAGIAAALVVLLCGVVAAVTHEAPPAVAAVAPSTTVARQPAPHLSTTSTTLVSLVPATVEPVPTTVVIATAVTAEPDVPDPESASRRLWDAYTQGDRTAASRVATPAVVGTMFSVAFDGGRGTFQGCTPDGDHVFQCQYVEDTGRTFDLTAQQDATGNNRIYVVTITSQPTTTTSTQAAPPPTSSPSTTTTTFPIHG